MVRPAWKQIPSVGCPAPGQRTRPGRRRGVVSALELQRPLVATVLGHAHVDDRVIDVGEVRPKASAPVAQEDAAAGADIELEVADGGRVADHVQREQVLVRAASGVRALHAALARHKPRLRIVVVLRWQFTKQSIDHKTKQKQSGAVAAVARRPPAPRHTHYADLACACSLGKYGGKPGRACSS